MVSIAKYRKIHLKIRKFRIFGFSFGFVACNDYFKGYQYHYGESKYDRKDNTNRLIVVLIRAYSVCVLVRRMTVVIMVFTCNAIVMTTAGIGAAGMSRNRERNA